ncbi:MAG: Ca2+-dependent phosphoinositide-specific phospholipase C [Gemmatimonadota bacterium]|nr:Ca2+-dependent phosphoinositide-specific phospholipase C [Gemmatimonadota bacterium]
MNLPDLRYNEVRQKSAHNAFERREGVYDQVVYWRIRSLELDLHKGKLGHGRLTGDWYIYHGAHNPNTSVHRLSDFLRLCRGIRQAIPRHEVITVFLDIRDDFHTTPGASQSGAALDRLLIEQLGKDRLHTPSDLLERAPLETTLQAAVREQGWPPLEELRGKILFVLTGPPQVLTTYRGSRSPGQCAAFLSSRVERKADVPGQDPDIAFFNMSDKHVKVSRAVRKLGFVSRGYYINDASRWKTAVEHDCHHLATDNINAHEDRWSQTARPRTGFPFQKLAGNTPSVTESGEMCGVWARSGDIWGDTDSFYYQFADCRSHPDNRYDFYISGANSHGDDWLKGGLIARASLAGNAPYFGVFRIAEHHALRVQYRVGEGGSTVARERSLGSWVIAEDTLMFVRLSITGGGHRARAWGSVDGTSWLEIGSFDFDRPLKYQGIGVSSHREASGAKFLFGVPNGRARPPFTRGQLVGPRGKKYGGGADWEGAARWKVTGFG